MFELLDTVDQQAVIKVVGRKYRCSSITELRL